MFLLRRHLTNCINLVGFMDSIMPSSVGFSLFRKDCNFIFPAPTQQVSQKPKLIFLCCGKLWLSFTGIRHALNSAFRAHNWVKKPAPLGLHLTLIVSYTILHFACETHPIYENKSYPLTTLHLTIDFIELNGNVFY